MGTNTSPKGGFAIASTYSIPIAAFSHPRIENGKSIIDVHWDRIPVSEEQHAAHLEANYFAPLRDMSVMEREVYPWFDYQHYPELPHGQNFTISQERLERWIESSLKKPENDGNIMLYNSLRQGRELIAHHKQALETPKPSMPS